MTMIPPHWLTWGGLFTRLIISSSVSKDPLAAAPQGDGKEPYTHTHANGVKKDIAVEFYQQVKKKVHVHLISRNA